MGNFLPTHSSSLSYYEFNRDLDGGFWKKTIVIDLAVLKKKLLPTTSKRGLSFHGLHPSTKISFGFAYSGMKI